MSILRSDSNIFNFNLHNLNEMFDKTIFVNDKFNIFLNNQNNTHSHRRCSEPTAYLQINYIEKKSYNFNSIYDLIINNSDTLCRNSIDKEYVKSTLKKAIGIIYVKKFPYAYDYSLLRSSKPKAYSLRSRSEDPDSDHRSTESEIIAFCILSLVDFYTNVGFPFDEKYTPTITNYFPNKVGEILLLCAIDDPIKVSIETETVNSLMITLWLTMIKSLKSFAIKNLKKSLTLKKEKLKNYHVLN